LEEKAIRGVSWTVLSYAVNRGLRTLSTVVLARLLVPADFGLMALALVTLSLINVFTDLGLGGVLVIRPDLSLRAKGTVLTMMVGTGLIGAALVAGASPLASDVLGDARVPPVIAVLSLTLVINVFAWFYETLMQRELEFRNIFICKGISTAAYVVIAITLAASGAGVWSLVAAELTAGVMLSIAMLARSPYRVRPAWDRDAARDVFSSGWGFLLQGGLGVISENADRLVVGRALGATQLGYYSMAYRVADLPYQAVGHPVAIVTFPSFARMKERGEDVGAAFLTALGLVALVACPVGVLLSACADPFTRAVFGHNWLPMIGVLSAFGIWATLRILLNTTSWLLNSMGRTRLLALVSALMLVAFIPAIIVAATLADAAAVAWVAVASSAVMTLILTFFAARTTGITAARYWRALRPVLLACPPSWAAAKVAAGATAAAGSGITLLASVAAGMVVYSAVIYLLEPPLLGRAAWQFRRAVRLEPVAETASPDLHSGPMAEAGKKGITRRRLLAGGAAGTAVVVGGGYGHYALGDEFESHVASVLGTTTAVAKVLTGAARARMSGSEYDRMAAEFLFVTTFPGSIVAPHKLRNRAVRRLLPSMLDESRRNLMYLGLEPPSDASACIGLLHR
jgi:lipopolysaccharide exporter